MSMQSLIQGTENSGLLIYSESLKVNDIAITYVDESIIEREASKGTVVGIRGDKGGELVVPRDAGASPE
eukprot:2014100-Rhodomonas_salina.2